jgi:ATP-binding cassette subfamily B protein
MLVEVLCDVLMPYMMALIVNRVSDSVRANTSFTNDDTRYIITIGAIMILLALIALLCGAIAARLAAVAAQGGGTELRYDLFKQIQTFSFADLDKFSVPSLITRLTTDITNIQMAGMMSLRMLIRAPFMLLFALILALNINSELALVFLVAIPILGIALYFIITTAHPRFRKLQKKFDALNASIQENLTGIRVVKSFVREDYEKEKFKKSNDDFTNTAIGAVKVVIFTMPLMQLVIYGCIVAILWFGSGMVADTTITRILTGAESASGMQAGDLISFISYVTQILISLMMISFLFLMFVRSKASAERVFEVMDTESTIKDPENPVMEVKDGSIVFNNVSFRYEEGKGEDTLSGINLSIASGENIGIIGATGSAKSTLVQLIPRLYDVIQGEVLVGGVNVKEYSLKSLRDAVAMVLQKNTLFSGTVRDNMKWGNEDATDEEIIEALKQAQAWPFVSKLEKGLDHWVEQGGTNFSGGQKQRLCIARSLLKKPKVIILDDSTSAVDMATDSKIRASFKENLKGITVIIIAQRVRSISHCDRIIVMDDGKINAIGTHEELLENCEIYEDIYNSQQEGVLADA